jgi:hypothetical protein
MRRLIVSGIGLAAIISGIPAHAEVRDDIYAAFARCKTLTNNRVWLDCIYGSVQPMREELGLPPAPDAQVRLVPAAPTFQSAGNLPAASPRKGIFSYLLGGTLLVNMVNLRSYSFDANGRFTVTLANGEIWQQMEDDHNSASWKEPASHYVVSILTAALGSEVMEVGDEDMIYKVRRLDKRK